MNVSLMFIFSGNYILIRNWTINVPIETLRGTVQ